MDVAGHLQRHGPVARRADLLRSGFDDRAIRRALVARRIFRVRHGWYANVGASDAVVRAVRVGGQVTGVEALRVRGLFLPRPDRVDLALPRNAARLRSPGNMRERLRAADPVRTHWVADQRNSLLSREWLASEKDALGLILRTAPRELAVAACDGLIRYRGWTAAGLDAVFARAPLRARAWRRLVDGRADSWGETAVRLRLQDAGVACRPQAEVPDVGRFDLRVSAGVFVEVDGAQHDESWAGEEPSSFERDHLKDLALARRGARSIRITYAMYEQRWEECLDAIRTAIALDRHVSQKLRRSVARDGMTAATGPIQRKSPEFW